MALLDDDQRNILIGVGIGVVTASLLKGIAPAFRGVGRPLAKAGIKSGITLMEKGREKFAHLSEVFEDLVAEVKTELETEARDAAAAGSPPTAPGTGHVQ
jgi:hypothetical protein